MENTRLRADLAEYQRRVADQDKELVMLRSSLTSVSDMASKATSELAKSELLRMQLEAQMAEGHEKIADLERALEENKGRSFTSPGADVASSVLQLEALVRQLQEENSKLRCHLRSVSDQHGSLMDQTLDGSESAPIYYSDDEVGPDPPFCEGAHRNLRDADQDVGEEEEVINIDLTSWPPNEHSPVFSQGYPREVQGYVTGK